MFVDLNIPWPAAGADSAELKKTIGLLVQFGYEGVAYNNIVEGKVAASKSNPIKPLRLGNGGEETSAQGALPSVISQSAPRGKLFHQLSRVTVIAEESNQNYQLNGNNANIASYDLVAIKPLNEKLLQQACQTFEVDIISLDMGTRLPFFLKPPTINLAIQRGIFFEISYGAAIRDTTARRHLITNAAALIRVTKGKNVIITSEAQRAMEVRGPYDVINLASVFSLNQALARNCISSNCRSLLYRAATRRETYRGVMLMEPSSVLGAIAAWKAGPTTTEETDDEKDEEGNNAMETD
ncbi:hypothetical protein HK104_005409 [Borealophlyctis nickersoniae]|nr:hypothetical protein HK104_005409 [Borealophlyctis nickersoniae]